MFGLGVWEIVGIVILALLLFGPSRLPRLGHSLGSAIGSFRRAFSSDAAQPSLQDRQDESSPESLAAKSEGRE